MSEKHEVSSGMAVTRWWQLLLGVVAGTTLTLYVPVLAFTIAIVLGLLLAWASLRSDGDDAMTASAAGYITGALGSGLLQVATIVATTWFSGPRPSSSPGSSSVACWPS